MTKEIKQDKKSRWGPVLAQRKSSRVPDSDKTMLARAQEYKKRQNLELDQSKQFKPNPKTDKLSLTVMAS